MLRLRARYYYYFWVALILTFTASLQGCETLGGGYENVDTSRKAILVSAAEVRGANMLLQDLVRNNVIDASSARRALNALRTASTNLRTALETVDSNGDPFTIESARERATVSIGIALDILADFAGEPL